MKCLNREFLCNSICVLTTLILTIIYEIFLIKKLVDTLYNPDFNLYHSLEPEQDPLGVCSFSQNFPIILQEANYLTPFSFLLILVHCVSNTPRRSYLITSTNRFLNALNYISLPKIQNVFSKKRRLLYSMGFSILSFHVISTTLANLFELELSLDPVLVVREITEQLSDVLFIGCRYMPIFMALDSNNLLNRMIVGVYLFLDLCLSWYQQAICLNSVRIAIFESTSQVEHVFIVCNGIINFLHSLFTSYMIVHLTLGSLLQVAFLKRHALNKIKDTVVANMSECERLLHLAHIDDLFICTDDLKYTKSLLANNHRQIENNINNRGNHVFSHYNHYKFETSISFKFMWRVLKQLVYKLCHDCLGFVDAYARSIYDPNGHFRYSLRFMSTQMVYFSCSFYISVFLANILIQSLKPALFPESQTNFSFNLSDANSLVSNLSMSSQVFCQIKTLDFLCSVPAVQEIDVYAWIWLSYFTTLFVSFAIFIFQLLQNFRGYKNDLLAIYRGEHEFKEVRCLISNAEIAVSDK